MQTMVTRFSSLPAPADGSTPGADTPTLDSTGRAGDRPTPGSSALSGSSDAGVRARFLREARVQGQLEHPPIVPVHDLEVFADGSAYFAMKRVRGRTLADILAALARGDVETARIFPLRKLLAAFGSVCLAVEFAHEKGVVHRDIKPSNIMLGDVGEVYLLDWGLAKLLAGDDADPASALATPPSTDAAVAGATVAGAVLGTPGYMAPEQIDASIAPIGPSTDVYALGVVLFEILSRRRYLEFKDAIDATLQTLQGTERRPSRRAAPDVASTIATELDELCARVLARTPAERVPAARAPARGPPTRARRRGRTAAGACTDAGHLVLGDGAAGAGGALARRARATVVLAVRRRLRRAIIDHRATTFRREAARPST